MKQRLQTKAKAIINHPQTQLALASLKPKRSIWSFLGILFLVIAPEIIALVWGKAVCAYANAHLIPSPVWINHFGGESLIYLFGSVSWVNLGFGIVLLIWLFF
jgi:hypothetical protein